jgi:hypothetical protein
MDVNAPQWDAYIQQFETVAQRAQPWIGKDKSSRPNLADAQLYLCLYGENGLTPDEEFAMLDTLAQANPLYRVDVETAYWLETVLFVP